MGILLCQISFFSFLWKRKQKPWNKGELSSKNIFSFAWFAWNGFFRPHPNKGYTAPADYPITLCNGCTKLDRLRLADMPANQVSAAAIKRRRRKLIGKAHYPGIVAAAACHTADFSQCAAHRIVTQYTTIMLSKISIFVKVRILYSPGYSKAATSNYLW